MAINIKTMKSVMDTASAVPPGWMYDAMTDSYINGKGLRITQLDIIDHGDLTKAIIAIFGITALQNVKGATSGSNQMASAPGANGPANPFMNAPMATDISNASITNGTFTVADPKPLSVISIETKLGRVSVNIETGDITIPVDVGRDDAIREFWLGFQKHFVPSNKAKYEKEIEDLKRDLAGAKASAVLMKEESVKQASKRVAEKIRKKYNGEKFIMVKPEDLIKFIEESK